MTLEDRIDAEVQADAEYVRKTQAWLAEAAPYAERIHAAPKHPAPGCSCFGCVGRDAAAEERAEALADRKAERMTDHECDRRADLYYGELR